ncbi:hypothetical protein [Romeriopsis navalis]
MWPEVHHRRVSAIAT